ncbi:mitochondrial carrier protein [Coprinopsis marcescibilis]|uniref:Small ribosomal subunit protein mS29 n=1 Tax=Coprinopsis marcescibilis TaxID=230819 RepID=A0A5C3KU75_COPMA|nr:mitochondrial carrier protein [Coprinopsis marcescibilis]
MSSLLSLRTRPPPTVLAVRHQTRGAAQKAAPARMSVQTVGGARKNKEHWKAKVAMEMKHTSRDLPVYAQMPPDRLRASRNDPIDPLLKSDVKFDLPQFNRKTITPENIGKIASFSLADGTPGQVFGVPKSMWLEFRLMPKPFSVIRKITYEATHLLQRAAATPSAANRVVLTGRAGCGKSYVLHQVVTHAAYNGWIVLYVPRASNLTNSTTPYTYDLRTQTYQQPADAHRTLRQLLAGNTRELSSLVLEEDVVVERGVFGKALSLADVVRAVVRERGGSGSACVVLEAVMRALEKQTKFPVLLAVDDVQALYRKTAYKDAFFNAVQPFHLSMPRMILEYASGKRSFARGAFLSALTTSDTTNPIPQELVDALELTDTHPSSPYDKRSRELVGYAAGLKALDVPGRLSAGEAAGVFGAWIGARVIGAGNYDELFVSKLTESDGNARDFVRRGLLASFEP